MTDSILPSMARRGSAPPRPPRALRRGRATAWALLLVSGLVAALGFGRAMALLLTGQ